MVVSFFDGEKICEVVGNVRWLSVESVNLDYNFGLLVFYKFSSIYCIYVIIVFK